MNRFIRRTSCAIACAAAVSPALADSRDANNLGAHSTPQACAARAQGVYGFQCHGSSFTGAALELVTFVGTVEGSASGFFEGYGTFNSSAGSVSTHVAGQATYGARHCFGHIDYTTNEILLPGGGAIQLPPISFDFVSVDRGKEILGTAVAPPGVTGNFVPRLTCRLVKIDH
jgi:hypothetical protein